MAFYKKDIVFIQRDDTNSLYQQVNVSASNAIIYVDSDGHIAASKISQFPYTWPSSSHAITSSNSITASHSLTTTLTTGGTFEITSSWAITSSMADSASYAITASHALNVSAATSDSSSWASSSISASHAINADTASYVLASSVIGNVVSASHALMSDTASYVSASSVYGTVESSSYASTASYIGSGSNNYFPQWNSNTLTATSFLYGDSGHIGIGTTDLSSSPVGALIINESAIRHIVLRNEAAGGIPWSLVSTDDNNLSSGSRLVFLAGSDQTDTPALLIWSSSAALKRVGINKTHPTVELDVSGSISASYYYSQFDDVGFVGTASWASNSISSSHALNANLAVAADFAALAGYANESLSSSYSSTASFALNSGGGFNIESGSFWNITASMAVSSSNADTASFALNAGGGFSIESGSSWNITSSVALVAYSSSVAASSLTSSYFYSESGSGAWHIYVEPTMGDLVFDFV